nr:spore coat protein CotJB [uncultured Agathobaculum sp.]
MTEREKLLGRVRMYDFALVEVIEYLDCHPDCEAALKYYREMRAAFDKAAEEYEDAFGPLTARETEASGARWRWIDGPWPWEGEDN